MLLSDASIIQNGLLPLAAVIALTFYSLVLIRRNRRRSSSTNTQMQQQFAALRGHSELRESMDELLLQIEDVSRRTNALLDTKFAKLDAVVRDADQRIARLEQLLKDLDSARTAMAAARQPARTSSDGVRPRQNAEVRAVPVEEHAAPAAPPSDPRLDQIYGLADTGLSAIKIASEMGMPLGEVEFALNLRRFTKRD